MAEAERSRLRMIDMRANLANTLIKRRSLQNIKKQYSVFNVKFIPFSKTSFLLRVIVHEIPTYCIHVCPTPIMSPIATRRKSNRSSLHFIANADIPNARSTTTYIVYAESLALLQSIPWFKHATWLVLFAMLHLSAPRHCIRPSAICVMAFLTWQWALHASRQLFQQSRARDTLTDKLTACCASWNILKSPDSSFLVSRHSHVLRFQKNSKIKFAGHIVINCHPSAAMSSAKRPDLSSSSHDIEIGGPSETDSLLGKGRTKMTRFFHGFVDFAFQGNILQIAFGLM